MRIVGEERDKHSPAEIQRAERELALRQQPEEAAFQRKLSLSSVACAVVGGLFVVWPLVILLVMGSSFQGNPVPDPDEPFMFRFFDQIFVGVAILQALAGLLLLAGGLGAKARKAFGPRLVAGALWLGVLYVVGFTLAFIPPLFQFPGPRMFSVVMAVFAVLNGAFWALLLWLPLRFFSSARVREACAGSTAYD